VLDGSAAQQLHRGKLQPCLGFALEQVQQDWHRGHERAGEEQRREKGDHSFLARVER
jgi:hypothetical protein